MIKGLLRIGARRMPPTHLCVCNIHVKSLQQGTVDDGERYDVVVVGGGHAGCEAAAASARVGAKTLLVTHKISTIGEMSCNPSFGGVGKGHLMKEIDALDGLCGRICDVSGVQYRMLNMSKGPAVWGPRAQIDRKLYRKHMQEEILSKENLSVREASVEDLIIDDDDEQSGKNPGQENQMRCVGVVLEDGAGRKSPLYAHQVILTAGTFLRGEIQIGMEKRSAGRLGDEAAVGIAKTIEQLGFTMSRLKTGTPPRILKNTIDYSVMTEWKGDSPPHPFSFENERVWIDADQQLSCFTTNTKPQVKRIVTDSLHLNRHIQEESNGPRYCPSIESKVLRFTHKDTHVCWIEPEGWNEEEIYLQGFSCTMPREHQILAVREIEGLEGAEISKFGYGVEYDFIDPRQLRATLETRPVAALYMAGQINGTTGYEEAAAQGIVAGINAARASKSLGEFVIERSEAYIGVMIDDLITQGTNEPYRMFTSRSEFRLTLRPDNADERLTARAYAEAGCVSEGRMRSTRSRLERVRTALDILRGETMSLHKWRSRTTDLRIKSGGELKTGLQFLGLLDQARAHRFMSEHEGVREALEGRHWLMERLRAHALYDAVLHEQEKMMREVKRDEKLLIPDSIDYGKIESLKNELREKLQLVRPRNLAAASRIQGITPSCLVVLLRYVNNNNNRKTV